MSSTTRRFARWTAAPVFVASCVGWTMGLLHVQATASTPALLISTSCGLLAVAMVMTWANLRAVPTR